MNPGDRRPQSLNQQPGLTTRTRLLVFLELLWLFIRPEYRLQAILQATSRMFGDTMLWRQTRCYGDRVMSLDIELTVRKICQPSARAPTSPTLKFGTYLR